MPLTVGEVYQVRTVCNTGAQIGVNVRHLRVQGTTGASITAQDLAVNLESLLAPLYKAALCTFAFWRGLGVMKIRPLPLDTEFVSTALAGPGTVMGDLLPKQVSGIISYRAATGGRRGRGRSYIPFPSENSSISTGSTEANYFTALAAIASATGDAGASVTITVASPPGTVTLFWQVFSKVDNVGRDIAASLANIRFATQRRRGDFGRVNNLPF